MNGECWIVLASFVLGIAFGGLCIGDYRAWMAARRAYDEGRRAGEVKATDRFVEESMQHFRFVRPRPAVEERPS